MTRTSNASSERRASAGTSELPQATARGEARRERVLALATDLFLAHGFSGVSVDDIIKAAGGSKISVYRHFGSKETLFEAVVVALCDEFRDEVEGVTLGRAGFEKSFRDMAHVLIRMAISPRQVAFYRMILGTSGRFPEVGRIWHRRGLKTMATFIEGRIAPWFASTGPNAVNIASLSSALHGAILFELLSRSVVLHSRPRKKAIASVVDAAWLLASSVHHQHGSG